MINSLSAPIRTAYLRLPRLSFAYPQVYSLTNLKAQRQINQAIYQLTQRLITDSGYYQIPGVEVTGTYELKTNERSILSLALIIYWFSGGAHGMTVVKSLTFNVDTGKSYSLAELFKPGSVDYQRVLSGMVSEQIKQRQIPLLAAFPGVKPDQDYYIADKSLVLYYQLYELAAYVYGILAFPISVYAIQNLIDENGPLGTMMY